MHVSHNAKASSLSQTPSNYFCSILQSTSSSDLWVNTGVLSESVPCIICKIDLQFDLILSNEIQKQNNGGRWTIHNMLYLASKEHDKPIFMHQRHKLQATFSPLAQSSTSLMYICYLLLGIWKVKNVIVNAGDLRSKPEIFFFKHKLDWQNFCASHQYQEMQQASVW